MAIPSRGIGWGTESNLLWQIVKQLQYLTKVAGSSFSSLISQTITCGVTDSAPSENAVCQALALKQDVLGKISLSDPEQHSFSDLVTANSYIKQFTNTDPTQENYNSETFTYTFTVPADTYFNNNSYFCENTRMNWQDSEGLVTYFGDYAFPDNGTNNVFGNITVYNSFLVSAKGNNIIGNITAGHNLLRNSTGNSIINNVTANEGFLQDSLSNNIMNIINVGDGAFQGALPTIKNSIFKIGSCGIGFALGYQGRIDVGYFGNSSGQDLPSDIFTTSNLTWIRTTYSNQFIDGGTPDPDILQALSNMQGLNPNSTVIYE